MNVDTFFGPMVILQTVTPVEPLLQKVVHKMFYPTVVSLYGTLTFFTESILVNERFFSLCSNTSLLLRRTRVAYCYEAGEYSEVKMAFIEFKWTMNQRLGHKGRKSYTYKKNYEFNCI